MEHTSYPWNAVQRLFILFVIPWFPQSVSSVLFSDRLHFPECFPEKCCEIGCRFYTEAEKDSDGERFPSWPWLKTQPVLLLHCMLVFFSSCGCLNWPLYVSSPIDFSLYECETSELNGGCRKMPLGFICDVLDQTNIFCCSSFVVAENFWTRCHFVQVCSVKALYPTQTSTRMLTALGELMRTPARLTLAWRPNLYLTRSPATSGAIS